MSRETKIALLLLAGEISYLLKTGKDVEAVSKLQSLWDRAYKAGKDDN